MVKCEVLGCNSRCRKKEAGVTFHSFPIGDPEKLSTWIKNMWIPNFMPTKSRRICSKHFEKKWFYKTPTGKVKLLNQAVPTIFENSQKSVPAKKKILRKSRSEAAFKHPRLAKSAVPTIFDESDEKTVERRNDSPENRDDISTENDPSVENILLIVLDEQDEETVEGCNNSANIDVTRNIEDSSIENAYSDKGARKNELLASVDTDTEIHSNDELMEFPVDEIEHDHCYTNNSDPETCIADNADHQVVSSVTFDISPVTISEKSSSTRSVEDAKCIKSIPKPWVVSHLSTKPEQGLVFLYPKVTIKDGIEIPITIKAVTVDVQKNLRYYIHEKLVENNDARLPQKLKSITDLPYILTRFQHQQLCLGIGEVDMRFLPTEETFKNNNDRWYHNKCPLLSKKRRCEYCRKLRKRIFQKQRRTRNSTSTRYRISSLSSYPEDQQKLELMKKFKCERRAKNRAQSQVLMLRSALKTQEIEMAAMENEIMDLKCSDMLIATDEES